MRCWICGSSNLTRVRESTLPEVINGDTFRISNSDYGRAGAIDRCHSCGFHQCSDTNDVVRFCEEMEDPDYERTRSQRAMQERAVLDNVPVGRPASGLRLLDVGAGSGILVEQALAKGYDAVGIEPSQTLQKSAAKLGLPVVRGVLPHPDIQGPFNVVTIIDVIEHVTNPIDLLNQALQLMVPDGILVVVTPDRTSLAARLMGQRWWHFRVAHIGYFEPKTLRNALSRAGLMEIDFRRPSWYFPIDYLLQRSTRYLPAAVRIAAPRCLAKITLPLNLRDSMMVSARRAP